MLLGGGCLLQIENEVPHQIGYFILLVMRRESSKAVRFIQEDSRVDTVSVKSQISV